MKSNFRKVRVNTKNHYYLHTTITLYYHCSIRKSRSAYLSLYCQRRPQLLSWLIYVEYLCEEWLFTLCHCWHVSHCAFNSIVIHPFLMLVATGSFSPKRGFPVKFCVDFNHFKSIIMNTLFHSKTLICSFLYNFRLLLNMLPTKNNLIYSSHLYEFVIWKWLKCTENWTGSPLTLLLPPGGSSTLESDECTVKRNGTFL